MQEKQPIEIIKRKVTSRIEYKMRWNNGSITYEPMVELTPQMLVIVNQWEWNQHQKKKEEKIQKSQQKADAVSHQQSQQIPEPLPQPIPPHRPRVSQPGAVKSIRKNGNDIEFLVLLKSEGIEKWVGLEEVKMTIPVALCDYLLLKVKFGGK